MNKKPMIVRDAAEAAWLNRNVLHCGHVRPGDVWDSIQAWDDPEDRAVAREILLRYRRHGAAAVVTDDERRQLAVCCRS
jgi:hypothetical protein